MALNETYGGMSGFLQRRLDKSDKNRENSTVALMVMDI